MKALLLGASGQLGTDIQAAVGSYRGRIRLTALTRADVDMADPPSIEARLMRHELDVIINCTGYNETDEAERNAQEAVVVNALAVGELARLCAARGARLLHVSTDYVFDGRARRPYVETDPIGPLNVYGASKAMGESLVRAQLEDHLILRVASLFGGAGAGGKGGSFVDTILKVARERGRLRVVSDQRMSPTSTADAARMILDALSLEVPAGTYHAVNTGQASWHDFATRILERARVPATVEPITARESARRARRPAFSAMNNAKLAERIGPIAPWTEALDGYLRARGYRPE